MKPSRGEAAQPEEGVDRLLRRTRADRGLPEGVDDDATLASVAAALHQLPGHLPAGPGSPVIRIGDAKALIGFGAPAPRSMPTTGGPGSRLPVDRRHPVQAEGVVISTRSPFAASGQVYFDAGWSPIPVTGDDKRGIPGGFTGCEGREVEQTDLNRWKRSNSSANIALRLPPGVVALDVDHYDEKRGADTIRSLTERCGPLPPTVVATARDLPSGKYLYRVPVGTRLGEKQAGPGVQIIQHHHRYVVCAPSVHHTGVVVRWVDEQSGEIVDLPNWDLIPDLPWRWIEDLSVTGPADVGPVADHEQVEAWKRRCPHNRRPGWLTAVIERVDEDIDGGHHDTMLDALCQVAREAEAGAYPASAACDRLRETWDRTTTPGRADEFDSMLAWAVGQLATEDGRRSVSQKKARIR